MDDELVAIEKILELRDALGDVHSAARALEYCAKRIQGN